MCKDISFSKLNQCTKGCKQYTIKRRRPAGDQLFARASTAAAGAAAGVGKGLTISLNEWKQQG
jgi:hypothetical protein